MPELSKKAREDLSARIGSQDVMAAFDLLIVEMAELGAFEIKPNVAGQKKAVHFKSGRVSYFAFITNKEWLLWYFRRPGLRDGIFSFVELMSWFPSLDFSKSSDSERVEAMLRIRSLHEAEAVLHFVRSKFAQK
jgi:hypothetical protein